MPLSTLKSQSESNISFVASQLGSGTVERIRTLLQAMKPAEIAHLLESLNLTDRIVVWHMVKPSLAGEILVEVNDNVRNSLLEATSSQDLIDAASQLETDDLADLVQDLPKLLMEKVLQAMAQQNRDRLEAVLSYDEHTAGGLMNLDTVTVRGNATIEVVLNFLRMRGKLPAQTDHLVVVDQSGIYQGVLPLSMILTCPIQRTVAKQMLSDFTAIPADMSASEVAILFEQRDLVSAPVIDVQGKLLGRITIDDVVDVIREEADHSLMSMAGLDEEQDMFAPVIQSTRKRGFWLAINLLTALLASWVIGLFEGTIEQIVALAVLMPIVASMGGIAGGQTLTLVIRALALRQLGRGNRGQLVRRELAIGALNGMFWASVIALIAAAWFSNIELGILIGVAMIINLVCAALAGASIPLILHHLGIDPALAGGVLLTTVTDVVGFLAFLGLATLFLL